MKPDPEAYATLDLARLRQRWDSRAAGWDRALEDPACHLHLDGGYDDFLSYVRTALSLRPAGTMLDLGCGTALVGAAMSDLVARVYAVDVSTEMLRVAASKRLRRLVLTAGDALRLPFRHSSFDVVVSRGVLLSHYGTHPERLLSEVRRVLQPGGRAMLDALHEGGRGRFPHEPEGKRLLTPDQLVELAAAAGLSVSDISGRPGARTLFVSLVRGSAERSPPTRTR